MREVRDSGSRYFGLTDIGRRRAKNEDAFAIFSDRGLSVVADGMGGHNAGEVASSEAVCAADALFAAEAVERMHRHPAEIQGMMQSYLEEINRRVFRKSQEKDAFAGMGCAFIVAFVNQGILHTCHAGDVRCYVCRDSGLFQITSDHTQVAELVRTGRMDTEGARRSQYRNVLTKAIGYENAVSPEYNSFTLTKGDRVLLCSDGLWGMVSDGKIQTIARKKVNLETICRKLVGAALAAGGKDNITVVIFEKG